MIRRECQILSQIKNDNVVQMIEFFETEQYFLIVMEYCEGGDMAQYLRENIRIKEEDAVPLFLQLLNGMSSLHQRLILHRE
jgi:calcium-dependent protein kinase